jgi:hypothetical protein
MRLRLDPTNHRPGNILDLRHPVATNAKNLIQPLLGRHADSFLLEPLLQLQSESACPPPFKPAHALAGRTSKTTITRAKKRESCQIIPSRELFDQQCQHANAPFATKFVNKLPEKTGVSAHKSPHRAFTATQPFAKVQKRIAKEHYQPFTARNRAAPFIYQNPWPNFN